MPNRASFWRPLGIERVSESQKLLKSAEKYFDSSFSSFCAKMSYKKVFLMRYETLGLLVNTLTANYDYSRSNRENLPSPILINLSKNL